MRNAAGEVPEIALLQVVHEVAALVVDGSHTDFSVQDVSPFGLLVPMELSYDPFVEPHVYGSQLHA